MVVDPSAVMDLQTLVREWTRQHVRAESLEEVEAVAVEVSRVVGQAVADEALAGTARRSYEGSSRPCACGRKAKFMGYRGRNLVTLVGEVRVARAYYYCRHCRSGVAPWDAAQGLSERCYSPAVKAVVTETAARMPYGGGMAFLARLTPLRIEESAAEGIVDEVGGRVRAAQAEAQASSLSGLTPWPAGPPVVRLYVTMDGSAAHIDGDWHEVKTGAVYEARPGEEGVDASGPKRYVSAQEPAEAFTARLYVEALQAGVHHAQEVVVIGDGAAWIWNLADEYFPHAVPIVDRFHAKQYLSDVAKAIYGAGSDLATQWARQRYDQLDAGDIDLIIAALNLQATHCEAARKCSDYLQTNRTRLRYHEFRAQGLCTSTGVVEAGCKLAIGTRLKRAGMHWTLPGANAIIALRCCQLSRRYADFWEVRAEGGLSA